MQTTYHRETPTKSIHKDDDEGEKVPRKSAESDDPEDTPRNIDSSRAPPQTTGPSFLSQLKVYNGTFSDESVWKIFLRSFPFVFSPVVRTTRGPMQSILRSVLIPGAAHPRRGSSFSTYQCKECG